MRTISSWHLRFKKRNWRRRKEKVWIICNSHENRTQSKIKKKLCLSNFNAPFQADYEKIIMQILMLLSLILQWFPIRLQPSLSYYVLCNTHSDANAQEAKAVGLWLRVFRFAFPPPSLFHSLWIIWQKDLLQQSRQLGVNAATNSNDLKPNHRKALNIESIFYFFPCASNVCVWTKESFAKEVFKIPELF